MNKFQAVLSLGNTVKESKLVASKEEAENWVRNQPEFKQGTSVIIYELAYIDNGYYVIGSV